MGLASLDAAALVQHDDVSYLARELVRIPSYTTEETPLAHRIFAYMQDVGLKARLDPVKLSDEKHSYNVMGTIPGVADGPSLLITGHMDHAPALGRPYDDLSLWRRDPFEGVIEGDWLYGKGAQDEKGGLCAMLVAAKVLLQVGFRPHGTLYFIPVQGHKRRSSGIRHLLASGFRSTYAINTENSGNALVPQWVGRAEGRIHLKTRAGGRELHFHFKEVDPNLQERLTVFEQLTRLLQALGPEMAPPEQTRWMSFTPDSSLPAYPQYRIEKIETVSQMHVIVYFQIRTVPGQTEESLRADLQHLLDCLRADNPHLEATLDFPSVPVRSAVHISNNNELVRAVAAAHREVFGREADIDARGRLGAAADASVLVEAGIETVIYGPGGGMSDLDYQRAVHEGRVPPDERVSIQAIIDAAKVYIMSAMSLCG